MYIENDNIKIYSLKLSYHRKKNRWNKMLCITTFPKINYFTAMRRNPDLSKTKAWLLTNDVPWITIKLRLDEHPFYDVSALKAEHRNPFQKPWIFQFHIRYSPDKSNSRTFMYSSLFLCYPYNLMLSVFLYCSLSFQTRSSIFMSYCCCWHI